MHLIVGLFIHLCKDGHKMGHASTDTLSTFDLGDGGCMIYLVPVRYMYKTLGGHVLFHCFLMLFDSLGFTYLNAKRLTQRFLL